MRRGRDALRQLYFGGDTRPGGLSAGQASGYETMHAQGGVAVAWGYHVPRSGDAAEYGQRDAVTADLSWNRNRRCRTSEQYCGMK
jgi:hypothetical protein